MLVEMFPESPPLKVDLHYGCSFCIRSGNRFLLGTDPPLTSHITKTI